MDFLSTTPINSYMQQAILSASKALETGDVPVGAVIVKDDRIIGTGWNCREAENRITGHAEIVALEAACKALGSWKLAGCDLYVTLEPCSMCASAIIQARIRAVYFGAWDSKAGAAGSVINLFREKWVNHDVMIYEGIMETSCKQLLDDFFLHLRNK